MAGISRSAGWGLGETISNHNPLLSVPEYEMDVIYYLYSKNKHIPTYYIMTILSKQFKKIEINKYPFEYQQAKRRVPRYNSKTARSYFSNSLAGKELKDRIDRQMQTNQLEAVSQAAMVRDLHSDIIRPLYDKTFYFHPNPNEKEATRAHYGIHLIDSRHINVFNRVSSFFETPKAFDSSDLDEINTSGNEFLFQLQKVHKRDDDTVGPQAAVSDQEKGLWQQVLRNIQIFFLQQVRFLS